MGTVHPALPGAAHVRQVWEPLASLAKRAELCEQLLFHLLCSDASHLQKPYCFGISNVRNKSQLSRPTATLPLSPPPVAGPCCDGWVRPGLTVEWHHHCPGHSAAVTQPPHWCGSYARPLADLAGQGLGSARRVGCLRTFWGEVLKRAACALLPWGHHR